MPIAQRVPSTGTWTSAQVAAITLPPSTAVGDLLLVAVANVNVTGLNAPAGWTRTAVYSAGTGQSLTLFWAQYSVSLTLTFTNATGVSAWVCNAFFQSGATIFLDGAPVAASNTSNSTTMATGAPTATGNVAGDFEALVYAWTSSGSLTAASGMTRDGGGANGSSVSVAIGHNNTTSLGANATTTAFAPTLSGSNSRKTGVGILLMAVPVPSVALAISDSFDTGTLNTSTWASYGTGQSMTASALQIAPPGTSGVYGGVVANVGANLTGAYAYVQITQDVNDVAGNVQSFQLQIDSSNYIELLHIDANIAARQCVATTVTQLVSIADPAPPAANWFRMHESGGVIYWMYSADRFDWTFFCRRPNPITVTALKVNLLAGCYQAVVTPGIGQFNYLNTVPIVYKNLTGTSNGVATSTAQAARKRQLTGISVGQSLGGTYSKVIPADTPIAWWRVGETAGTTATDVTGAHTGTYASTGVTLNQASGIVGDTNPSILLAGTTGSTGLISIPASAAWRPVGGGWSMEAWINLNALSGTGEILRLGGADGWFMRYDGNFLTTLWGFSGGAYSQPSGGVIPAAGAWVYVVGVYDGVFIRHYINGVAKYLVAETRVFGPTNTGTLCIGAQDTTNGGEFFLGKLDEVAIYNFALTPTQVSAHYAAGINPITTIIASHANNIPSVLSAGRAVTTTTVLRRVALTGISAGAGTEVGQPSRRRPIVAASAGTVAVSAQISAKRLLVAASAGIATVSGVVSKPGLKSNPSVAGSTASGVVTARRSLAATISGLSTTSATILRRRVLLATTSGVATTSAQIVARRLLTALSAGSATEAGQPTRKARLAGTSAGVATEAGQPSVKPGRIFPNTSAGSSSTVGQILIRSSTVPPVFVYGIATTTGVISCKRILVANASAGKATTTAIPTRIRYMVVSSAGKATVAATIGRIHQLIVSAAGKASVAGAIVTKRVLVVSSNGVATTSTPLVLRKRVLLGTSSGVAVVSRPTLLRVRALIANANGKATVHGRPINIALTLWNGSTFVLAGHYPVVLWDQAEFELQPEEGESVDYVAYKSSTDQFNPVLP